MDKKEQIQALNEQMRTFIGTKVIRAVEMNRQEYNDLRGWTVPSDENPEDEGYLVEYQNDSQSNVSGFDGYISWSPTKPFDEAYRLAETPLDRMIIERDHLEEKVDKLTEFLRSDKLDGFSQEYIDLMTQQRNLMDDYLCVLEQRIDMVEEGSHVDTE